MALFGRGLSHLVSPRFSGIGTPQEVRAPVGGLKFDPNEDKAGGTEPVRSAGLWRGAFMRKNIPRTLQVIGAALQQIDNPQGQLGEFTANEAEQQRQAAVQAAMEQRTIDGKNDRAADAQEAQYTASRRQQLEQIIASLPPEQQVLARLNPEGYVNGMMRHLYPAPHRSGEDGIADDDGWTYHD